MPLLGKLNRKIGSVTGYEIRRADRCGPPARAARRQAQAVATAAAADTVEKIIAEIAVARISERGASRADDRISEASRPSRRIAAAVSRRACASGALSGRRPNQDGTLFLYMTVHSKHARLAESAW